MLICWLFKLLLDFTIMCTRCVQSQGHFFLQWYRPMDRVCIVVSPVDSTFVTTQHQFEASEGERWGRRSVVQVLMQGEREVFISRSPEADSCSCRTGPNYCTHLYWMIRWYRSVCIVHRPTGIVQMLQAYRSAHAFFFYLKIIGRSPFRYELPMLSVSFFLSKWKILIKCTVYVHLSEGLSTSFMV